MHAELARARAEQVALHADDVADIEQLEELEVALADGVLLDVDLQPLAVLLQVRESGLAHVAQASSAGPAMRTRTLGRRALRRSSRCTPRESPGPCG